MAMTFNGTMAFLRDGKYGFFTVYELTGFFRRGPIFKTAIRAQQR